MKSAKKEGSDAFPAKKTAQKGELTEGVDEQAVDGDAEALPVSSKQASTSKQNLSRQSSALSRKDGTD